MRLAYDGDGDFRQRRLAYTRFFSEHGRRLEGAHALQEQASGSFAREALWGAARALEDGKLDAAARMMRLAREMRPRAWATRLYWQLAIGRLIGAEAYLRASGVRCGRAAPMPTRQGPRAHDAVPLAGTMTQRRFVPAWFMLEISAAAFRFFTASLPFLTSPPGRRRKRARFAASLAASRCGIGIASGKA